MKVGTRVVTAYGSNPQDIVLNSGRRVLGQFGTVVRVNEDGWHDVLLDEVLGREERISLNEDRYEIVG